MTTKILAFAGHKQSGKSTSCNFLHGYQLRAHHVIDGFGVTELGQLVINTSIINPEGEEENGQAILDTSRNDMEFAEWAAYSMWPYVKRYSFAGALKEIATGIFELKPEQVHGAESQKNSKTWFKWEDMPGIITDIKLTKKHDIKKLIDTGALKYHRPGKMSAREFLQFFGTDVCRKIYEDVWQSRLMNDIAREGSLLAVIDDCRFPNEAEAIQGAGGHIIKLTRGNHKDLHPSECALDKYENFDAVIDNKDMTIQETNIELINILDKWGWLGKVVAKPTPEVEEPKLVGGIHKFKEDP